MIQHKYFCNSSEKTNKIKLYVCMYVCVYICMYAFMYICVQV